MFLKNLFEAIENKTAVLGWGRGMGHKGHMLLAKAVLHHAKENQAKPYFVVSRTSLVDPSTGQPWADKPTFTKTKDDPLTPDEKLATYRKVFPQNADVFSVATADATKLEQVLAKIAKDGYNRVVLVVGEDQKQSMAYLTRPDKSGAPPYKQAGLNDLEIISRQDTTEPSSMRSSPEYQEGPRATPMRQVLLDPSKSEEEQFAIWRRDMPDNLSDEEVMDLMQKAKQRMSMVPAAKNKKISATEDAEPVDREFALVKKLGRLGQRIVQNPKLWEKYTEAVDNDNNDWIISLIQDGTGADKAEVMKLAELFGEIGGGLGRIIDFAWAVKEGTWEQDFMNPYRQYRNQGVAERQINELDIFAPVTTYVRLANGEYVAANWRRNQDLSSATDSASFISVKPLDSMVSKRLGLDNILKDPRRQDDPSNVDNLKGNTTIAKGGPIQGTGPLGDRTIKVVDITNPVTIKNAGVPDSVIAKVAQWAEKTPASEQILELSKDTLKKYVPARIDSATKMVATDKQKAKQLATKDIPRALNKLKDPQYGKQGVAEAFGPLPKDNQQIRLGRHTVDIERVGLNKNYISFAWHDSQGKEHYEEVPVGDLGSYDDLIKRIKDEISYQERKYTDQGVAEGLGLYGPFTVTISTGERPQSRTKTKKFRREDDAILWAQDWLEDFPQYSFATAEVTDPEGNVVWTTDESLEEQGVAEGKIKGVDGKACWKGKRYAGKVKKADGTYKDKCVPVSEGIEQKMASLIKLLENK